MQSMERARGASTALTRLNVHLCPLWKSANGIKASYLQLHSPRGGQTPGPEVWLAKDSLLPGLAFQQCYCELPGPCFQRLLSVN